MSEEMKQASLLRRGADNDGRTRLVGRGPLLSELARIFETTKAELKPQTVTVLGSAGIGKSRVVQAFVEQIRSVSPPRPRVYRASGREGALAFALIERLLKARFGLIEGARPEVLRDHVRNEIAGVVGEERANEFLHFLGGFLDLDLPESPLSEALERDARELRYISRAVLRRFLEIDAESGPLVLIFENLHVADAHSLEIVEYLAKSLKKAPVLLLCAARPELLARKPEWEQLPGYHRVEVLPLSEDESASLMLHALEPLGDVPNEFLDAAVEVAGGSPYLLEQMVKAFFSAGAITLEEDGSWTAHLEKLEEARLPLTIEEAIAARVSALSAFESEVLERASAMGGVFWLGALISIERIDAKAPSLWGGHESLEQHYRDMLQSLAERDYVLEMPDSTVPGETEYTFKHNLEREALYRLMDSDKVKRRHAVVARWLELKIPDRREEQLELLAQHYEQGGATALAARRYIEAGDRARDRFANRRAIAYYRKGLAILEEGDVKHRVSALHHLGDVLQIEGDLEEAREVFEELLTVAFRLDHKAKGGVAHNRIGRLLRAIGHLDDAMRHLGTGLALFTAAADDRGVASSLDDIGKVHWMRGDYESSERFIKKALAIRLELGHERSIALSYNNLGLVYQDSGRFQEAQGAFQEALTLRQKVGDLSGIAQTMNNLGTIHQDDGDHERAVIRYEEALKLAKQVGDRMRMAVILTNLGESRYRLKQPTQAIETLKGAEEISATLGDRILEGEILRGLAKAHMLIHDFGLAREYVERSIALFEEARGKPYVGVALRTLGEISAAAGWGGEEYEAAKNAFLRSITLFEELGNDIELASSLEAYAGFLEKNTDGDPSAAHEAMQLRGRADGVRSRLRQSESESGLTLLDPLADTDA